MGGLGRTFPALPARDIATAVAYFRDRFGFASGHVEDGFAVLERDAARVHLWAAGDRSWSEREDLRERPVRLGTESFLAGTARCRIETNDLDALYAEFAATNVLHPVSRDGITETDFGRASSPSSTPTATSSSSSIGSAEAIRRALPLI